MPAHMRRTVGPGSQRQGPAHQTPSRLQVEKDMPHHSWQCGVAVWSCSAAGCTYQFDQVATSRCALWVVCHRDYLHGGQEAPQNERQQHAVAPGARVAHEHGIPPRFLLYSKHSLVGAPSMRMFGTRAALPVTDQSVTASRQDGNRTTAHRLFSMWLAACRASVGEHCVVARQQ